MHLTCPIARFLSQKSLVIQSANDSALGTDAKTATTGRKILILELACYETAVEDATIDIPGLICAKLVSTPLPAVNQSQALLLMLHLYGAATTSIDHIAEIPRRTLSQDGSGSSATKISLNVPW